MATTVARGQPVARRRPPRSGSAAGSGRSNGPPRGRTGSVPGVTPSDRIVLSIVPRQRRARRCRAARTRSPRRGRPAPRRSGAGSRAGPPRSRSARCPPPSRPRVRRCRAWRRRRPCRRSRPRARGSSARRSRCGTSAREKPAPAPRFRISSSTASHTSRSDAPGRISGRAPSPGRRKRYARPPGGTPARGPRARRSGPSRRCHGRVMHSKSRWVAVRLMVGAQRISK